MGLITPQIIAPDTSQWANWLDDALGTEPDRRAAARGLHQQLLDQGKIAFLSWHHLEELLGIASDENARARVAYLQSLPLIAWMRFPDEEVGLGAIVDILAAEAIAVAEGCDDPADVRDHVRARLMRTGPAIDAIGNENWVWEVVRPHLLARRPHVGMVAALSGFSVFDMNQTLAQAAAQQVRSPEERKRMLVAIHAKVMREATEADPKRSPAEARAMADEFISRVLAMAPKQEVKVRDLLVSNFISQGLDPEEIRDEAPLSNLSLLVTFRQHLQVVAERTDLSFSQLKQVRMERLPSWLITDALRRHGQKRRVRPASDVLDEHLAVLAAYTDLLYVDRRTHEDFRRVRQKSPEVARLLCPIAKAKHYSDLLAADDH